MPRKKLGRPRISTESRENVFSARFTRSEAKKIKAGILGSGLSKTEWVRKQILNGAKLSRIEKLLLIDG